MRFFNLLRKLVVFLVVTLSQLSPLFSQEDHSPFLSPDKLDGGETTRYHVFDGNSLWGYINGGADIYLEYGFEQVQVQEIRNQEKNYKIEIYRMIDDESAYGIFTVSTFRCQVNNHQHIDHYCETNYQIQFALGDSYVSITNETGDDEGKRYIRHLASVVEAKTDFENFSLPLLFQHELFKSHTTRVKLIKGDLGLQNGFAFWSGKFDFPEDYKIQLLPIRLDAGEINLAIMEFNTPEAREKFCENNNLLRKNGVERNTWNHGETGIVFFETTLSEEECHPYKKVLERMKTR